MNWLVWVPFYIGIAVLIGWGLKRGIDYFQKKSWLKKPKVKWSWKLVWVPLVLIAFSPLLWWGLRVVAAVPAYFFFDVPPHSLGLTASPEEIAVAEEKTKIERRNQNIRFSDGAVFKEFQQPMLREIIFSASSVPTWRFVGITPPQADAVHVDAYAYGPNGIGQQVYLLDGDMMNAPLKTDELEAARVTIPGEITPVVSVTLPIQAKNIGANPNTNLSVWYLQNEAGKETEMNLSLTPSNAGLIEQWVLEVGREEVEIRIPPDGWDFAWIVPIRDEVYQSTLQGQSVSPAGLTAPQMGKLYEEKAKTAGKNLGDINAILEEVQKAWEGRPEKDGLYQALLVSVDKSKPQILSRHQMLNPKKSGEATSVRLFLNAKGDDFTSKHTTPAKVLVGWRKNVRFFCQ